MVWLTSRAALPHWNSGSLTWRPATAASAATLSDDLRNVDPEAFAGAVDAEARRRLDAFARGVRAYRGHPRPPPPPSPPVVWEQGSTRLLDYGLAGSDGAAPLLLVPSLINRAYVLDLTEKRSLARSLAAAGFRPLLVDWGAPGSDERGFTLTDYIAGRLEDALDAAVALAGRPAAVVGYCMGGLLALTLALRKPAQVGALVLMATPWDFHAIDAGRSRLLEAMAPRLASLVEPLGLLPVDVLQAMFAGLDPYQTTRKFQRFADLAPGSDNARHFVALEDWLNDGVPLTAPVVRECLIGWYVENQPARGVWRIAGRPVRPAEITVPALVVVPKQDYIVPPASALPLAGALGGAEAWTLPAGHIGMVVGNRAPRTLYRPLAAWLATALA